MANSKNNSTFFDLNNGWSIVEYEYNAKALAFNVYNILAIRNSYTTPVSTVLCSFNPAKTDDIVLQTNNPFNTMLYQRGDNKYIAIEETHPLNFYTEIDNLIKFSTPYYNTEELALNCLYDCIRVYIRKGYNFDDQSGFVLSEKIIDNNSKAILPICVKYTKKEDNIKYLVHELRYASDIYDRYIEYYVLNLSSLNSINDATKFFEDSLPSEDTAKIYINLSLISEISETSRGQKSITVPLTEDSSVNQTLLLSIESKTESIGCQIQESSNGDYFEFFGTYNTGFLSDYVYSQTFETVALHSITVYEHLMSGLNEIEDIATKVTANFTIIQDSDFDKPLTFRPIVMNPNCEAITIEYYMKLNRRESFGGSEIIRRATLTYTNPKKYSKVLSKINVDSSEANAVKVVNKIVNEKIVSSPNSTLSYQLLSNYKFNNYKDSSTVIYKNVNDILLKVDDSVVDSNKYYKQGELVKRITKSFDNYIEFKFYDSSEEDGITEFNLFEADDSNFEYSLVLQSLTSSNVETKPLKLEFKPITTTNNSLMFYIPETQVTNLTSGELYIVKTNYITDNNSKKYISNKTTLYRGNYEI